MTPPPKRFTILLYVNFCQENKRSAPTLVVPNCFFIKLQYFWWLDLYQVEEIPCWILNCNRFDYSGKWKVCLFLLLWLPEKSVFWVDTLWIKVCDIEVRFVIRFVPFPLYFRRRHFSHLCLSQNLPILCPFVPRHLFAYRGIIYPHTGVPTFFLLMM